MNKRVALGLVALCTVLTLSGCGTGLLAAQPTATLVPLPEAVRIGPSPIQVAKERAAAATRTSTDSSAQQPRPATSTLAPLTPTASATPKPTFEPTSAATPELVVDAIPDARTGSGSVTADRLNARSGPGIAYPRLGHLDGGAEVMILGRNERNTWWEIVYSAAGEETAWVSADYIETDIAVNTVPIVKVAPPPESVPAAASTSSGFAGKIVFQESSGGRIFTINADGTGLTYLTNGLDPDWSPNGQQIVFTRWEWDPPGVFVINADGSGEKEIVPGPKSKGPRWSPDGSHIVFTSERTEPAGKFCFKLPFGGEMCMELPDEDRWKISVLDLATEHIMDPATDPFSYAPSWSPDGTRLVYDGVRGLRPADPVEGHDQGSVYIDYEHRDMYPVWSPRSDRIAFMFRQHDHWEIYGVNADGSVRERLTESPLFEAAQNSVAPEWSPDGEWIAFLTDRGGTWEIWLMRPDGSEEQPLFAPSALEGIEFQYYEQSEHVLDWWMPPSA